MTFLRFSQKRTAKDSSDSSSLSFDLLSNLAYMASLSIGHAPRDAIFQQSMDQPFKTAIYFKEVYLLTKKLGFEYTRALRLVVQRAKARSVQSLLLRFAGAVGAGESEHEFLISESRIERDRYAGEYGRQLQALQRWGDAYAALLVSSSLIVVVALISSMIADVSPKFLMLLIGAMVIITAFGIYIIRSAGPKEIVAYKGNRGPKVRRRAMFLLLLFGPIGVAAAGYLSVTQGAGPALLALGLSMVPVGVFAYQDDQKMAGVDQEIAGFLRSLANVAAALGTTLSIALSKVDIESTGALKPYLARLRLRLESRLSPEVCWERFADEIGSQLVHRTCRMVVDGVALGGSPDTVSASATEYARVIALLRAQRAATALPFAMLVIPLHVAMTALLVFMLEIMQAFNLRIIEATSDFLGQDGGQMAKIPDLPAFHPSDTGLLSGMIILVVVVLTIANSLVPTFATGGHILKIFVFAPVVCVTSAMGLIYIPKVASTLI